MSTRAGNGHRAGRPISLAAPDAPKSAARLAAELAFSLPPQPGSSASGPIVVVRKTRGLAPARPEAVAQPAAAEDRDAPHKSPRIFRVAPAPGAAADGPAQAQPAPAGEGHEPHRTPRRRLLAADRRPGPLLQVYQAPPSPQADAAAADAGHAEGGPRLLEALARQLAGIDPVFDDIQRAQAFRFMEDGSEQAWHGLSAAADAVHEWIRVQLDSAEGLPEAAEGGPQAPATRAARGPSRESVFHPHRP